MSATTGSRPSAPPSASIPQQPPLSEPVGGYSVSAADVLLDVAIRSLIDLFQRALAAPIDRIMVLTAVEGELVRQGRLAPTGWGGFVACIKRVWRKEGFGGFFRGVLTDAALSIPSGFVDALASNVVFVALQAVLPERFASNMSYTQVLLVTMAATTASVAVAAPYNALRKSILTNYMADIVAPFRVEEQGAADASGEQKTDATTTAAKESPTSPMSEGYRYATATETARSIQRRQGWGAFYRSASLDPIVICAYRGIYVAAVALVSPATQAAHPLVLARGMAIAADLLTQPLEVLSRRVALTASDDAHPPYKGVVDCARTVAKTEGVSALWSGLRFRLAVSAATVGLQLALSAGSGLLA